MSYLTSITRSVTLALFIVAVLASTLFAQVLFVHAADNSITINSVTLTLHDDDDENEIANIDDTIRIVVDITNLDGACDGGLATTTVTVDLTSYGGDEDEELSCITEGGDGADEVWRLDFVITDAGEDGIDVAANNAGSVVTVSVTDEDEDAAVTDDSNNLAEAADTIAPIITEFEVTGGSGTDGTFIVGDTITVTWNNSATGDDNDDTIDEVFVLFFGDELVEATEEDDIWTATLDVDDYDDLQDVELNITVTVTDNAGNSRATGTDDVAVDNVAPSTPVASPGAGSFTSSQNVTLTSAGSDSIRYTTTDLAPTCSTGEIYSGAIKLTGSRTIQAIGCDDAGNTSALDSFTFTKTFSGSSGSGSSKQLNTPASAHAGSPLTASAIAGIIEQNRNLLLQAQALGISLPKFVQDILGVTADPAGLTVRDLTLGAAGSDVSALQNVLIGLGHAVPAGATGYFGVQTQGALAAYQTSNSITPASGYFGAITRAFMKSAGVAGIWW